MFNIDIKIRAALFINIFLIFFYFTNNIFVQNIYAQNATVASPPSEEKSPLEQNAIKYKNNLIAIDGNYTYGSDPAKTIVVFYDYNCPYSRLLFPILEHVLSRYNTQYKVIYKPVGIQYDPTSRLMAELVVAANDPSINKFKELHNIFINNTNKLPYTEDKIKDIINNQLKLSYDNLIKIIQDKQLGDVILKNHIVYDQIKFPGVPGLIAVKLDTNNNIVDNKLYYVAGADQRQLEISWFKVRN